MKICKSHPPPPPTAERADSATSQGVGWGLGGVGVDEGVLWSHCGCLNWLSLRFVKLMIWHYQACQHLTNSSRYRCLKSFENTVHLTSNTVHCRPKMNVIMS